MSQPSNMHRVELQPNRVVFTDGTVTEGEERPGLTVALLRGSCEHAGIPLQVTFYGKPPHVGLEVSIDLAAGLDLSTQPFVLRCYGDSPVHYEGLDSVVGYWVGNQVAEYLLFIEPFSFRLWVVDLPIGYKLKTFYGDVLRARAWLPC